jgi:hypothetical protein
MGHSTRFLPYLAGAAVAVAALIAAGVPIAAYLPLLVALACPLAMVFMMRGMAGMHAGPRAEAAPQPSPTDPPAQRAA